MAACHTTGEDLHAVGRQLPIDHNPQSILVLQGFRTPAFAIRCGDVGRRGIHRISHRVEQPLRSVHRRPHSLIRS